MTWNKPAKFTWLLLVVVLLLQGCETMDADSCQGADWYELGLADGERGTNAERGQDLAEECTQSGIAADQQAYRNGWENGIIGYCTKDRGFDEGRGGNHYQQSCPNELADSFSVDYLLGQSIFTAHTGVERIRYELDEARDKAAKLGISDERRGQLRSRRKDLEDDLDSAKWQLAATKTEARNHGFNVY